MKATLSEKKNKSLIWKKAQTVSGLSHREYHEKQRDDARNNKPVNCLPK